MRPESRGLPTWISEAAELAIAASAEGAHPYETGGVLVGVVVDERPWITDAVEIPSATKRTHFYQLREGVRHRAVAQARRVDRRVGYLGDWHSHTSDVGISSRDTTSVIRLAGDNQAACPCPVLVVARRVDSGYILDVRQVNGSELVEPRLVSAGPLAPELRCAKLLVETDETLDFEP